MKRIGLFLAIVLMASIIIGADNFYSIDGTDGSLPRDGRGKSIQVGRWFQLYDGSQSSLGYLNETDFATHVNWDVTNDITDSGGLANWSFVDSVASTLKQVNADQLNNVRDEQNLLLTYTVYDSTAIAGGDVAMWVSGICDSTALSVSAGVDKTQAITTGASASSADFVINIKADGDVTAGEFSVDDIELTGYYESPATIADGSSITLNTPTNAVELIIDSGGNEVTIETGSSYFNINSMFSLPCVSDENIIISNDSGNSVTLYFIYIMI